MSYGWINGEDFSFNTFLLFDTWIINNLPKKQYPDFTHNFSIALSGNPVVHWYLNAKCPEHKEYFDSLVKSVPNNLTPDEIRQAEIWVLEEMDTTVVYVYPEIMDGLDYITAWDNERLFEMTDFSDKIALDIGSGTGRLAFAAATVARAVYASEPVDRLREHMRKKKSRLEVDNIYIMDGKMMDIPFQDEFFDIVMSGHTFGEDYAVELREMMRVTKPGGYIIDCPGEDDKIRPEGPKKEVLELGFQYLHYTSKLGGDVYRYWIQKPE
ncbi:MAG: methyltransferase domain-containing protein [Dehalococcoidales bacterium]|nr:MAG: methyltransferase domain-containing protein [Dehalococcoidales bacterium]